MVVEFDSNKSGENQRLRGLSFELVTEFDFQNALVVQDQRKDYGEKRWQAIGMLNNRLHVVVFTLRGLAIRVISLRKANNREVRLYEKNKTES